MYKRFLRRLSGLFFWESQVQTSMSVDGGGHMGSMISQYSANFSIDVLEIYVDNWRVFHRDNCIVWRIKAGQYFRNQISDMGCVAEEL